ncbi:MAG: serine--tRNA ligase [Alphaproteobacteria bacterium]
MHDIKWIRENKEEFNKLIATRNSDAKAEKIIDLDEERRQLVTVIQQLQKARNDKAANISNIKDKSSYEYKQSLQDARDINDKISQLEHKLEKEDKLNKYVANVPNLPALDVPIGSEKFNKEVRKWGKIPQFNFTPKQHFEIGENLKMMDFESAAKISGSRFVFLKKDLAKLERALANFMLDIHINEYGYTEVSPPHLVKDPAMFNVGQLPKFAEDSFSTGSHRLIPTAEVPLTNLVANTILNEEELPIKYTAYSLCFRAEAGSAGRDTRGMIRQHQFSKIELVTICKPEDSEKQHEDLTKAAESILQRLELPYRVMLLSTEDMGFSARKTYDLEVWLPGQDKYREISSCSNFGDFQARRMKARYRTKGSKESILVNTINGSGLAIGRTIVAILENYQNADGSVTIPKVLVNYMGGQTKITM